MRRQFKRNVVMLLAVFAVGAFFGALWHRGLAEAPSATSPASTEDLAKLKADLTPIMPVPVKVQAVTNATTNSPS